MYEAVMRKCFRLALKGKGKVSPNPLVGCVVLDKFNNEISLGYHSRYGANHAERDALLKLEKSCSPSKIFNAVCIRSISISYFTLKISSSNACLVASDAILSILLSPHVCSCSFPSDP